MSVSWMSKAASTPATMSKQRSTLSMQHSTLLPKNGNNVERVYRKISSFRQSRNKLNMFNLFRLCWKNRSTCSIRQCCFDIVAGVDGYKTLGGLHRHGIVNITYVFTPHNMSQSVDDVTETALYSILYRSSYPLISFCSLFISDSSMSV